MTMYRMTVEFQRDLEDDVAVILNKYRNTTGLAEKLAQQLAAELQEAYNVCGMGGFFEVTCVRDPAGHVLREFPHNFKEDA